MFSFLSHILRVMTWVVYVCEMQQQPGTRCTLMKTLTHRTGSTGFFIGACVRVERTFSCPYSCLRLTGNISLYLPHTPPIAPLPHPPLPAPHSPVSCSRWCTVAADRDLIWPPEEWVIWGEGVCARVPDTHTHRHTQTWAEKKQWDHRPLFHNVVINFSADTQSGHWGIHTHGENVSWSSAAGMQSAVCTQNTGRKSGAQKSCVSSRSHTSSHKLPCSTSVKVCPSSNIF